MDARVDQHIDKGKEDGLYISCVASSANMWAIVMDAGTGFTSQVYELSPVFLHKVGILESAFPPLFTLTFNYAVVQQFIPSYSPGVDNGTVGQELLCHFTCWSKQWQCPCGNVPRYAKLNNRIFCCLWQLCFFFF